MALSRFGRSLDVADREFPSYEQTEYFVAHDAELNLPFPEQVLDSSPADFQGRFKIFRVYRDALGDEVLRATAWGPTASRSLHKEKIVHLVLPWLRSIRRTEGTQASVR